MFLCLLGFLVRRGFFFTVAELEPFGTVTFCCSGTETVILLQTLAEPDPLLINYGSGTVT
jgi:hypothetical protein